MQMVSVRSKRLGIIFDIQRITLPILWLLRPSQLRILKLMHNLNDQRKAAAEDSEMAESIEIVVRESFKQYIKINHSQSDIKVSAPQVYRRKDNNWVCSCCSCWYHRDISNYLHVGITIFCYHYLCS